MTNIAETAEDAPICSGPWLVGPEIPETIITHMEAVLNTGTLPKALKLVVVGTLQLNRTLRFQEARIGVTRCGRRQ
jgi:hypothetical protein